MLRISTSLDHETVLREVLESARSLTGGRYGAIVTVDGKGVPRDFITSGFTEDEHRRMAEWPDGPRLFEHFRDLPGALRLADVPAYVRSLGFSSDLLPRKTFLGMPMRHRGIHVGNFYLVEKEDGEEFTTEDEEILVLLASQAAAAIANARAYRDEQRARADLEALVETSPVGVAVFDARSGRPVSFNREAKRIVESLLTPGRPAEELLQVLTYRRGDGREIALDQFSLSSQLTDGEKVRAEEIVLSTPDGRSLATLVNATPIHAEDGTVASVVVTMQDLAPLEELERQRTEFLGMVSHELRAPLMSIKGSTTTLLGASSALDPAEAREIYRIIDDQADHMRDLIGDLLDVGRIDAGTLSVSPEPSDLAALVDKARNTFLSSGGVHTVLVDLSLELPRVMADRGRMVQVLNNLLSNASRHSPPSAPITISAECDGVHAAVSVSDKGRGIPVDQLSHLFRKYAGVSTGDGQRRIGEGLGLAICKGLVEAHGGRIWAESGGTGQGSRFTFTLPVVEESAAEATRSRPRTLATGQEEPRILVVDDDPQTLRYVRDALATAGYVVLETGDPEDLAHIVRTEKPDLILLDLMLPGTDGIELMERIPELAERPVIFISAYGKDDTIARVLECGAADYIVKPFSPTELTARIRAALRRRKEPEPFRFGDLVIHYDRRRVTIAGRPVSLTATEYDLLRVLSANVGRVSTYEALLRQVWGVRGRTDTRILRAFILKLRHKLGDDANNPAYIFNERGVGYHMATPDSVNANAL